MFENPYWIHFFNDCRPAFTISSRYKSSNSLLDEEAEKMKLLTLEKIRSAASLTLVSDGWTNINGDSLINIIFCTPEPVFYLPIAPQSESHTGEYIAGVLGRAIDEVGAEH